MFLLLITLSLHPADAAEAPGFSARSVRPMIIRSSAPSFEARKPKEQPQPAVQAVESPSLVEPVEIEKEMPLVAVRAPRGPQYLPMAGSLPLRYATPDRWPDPLPEPEEKDLLVDDALAEVAFTDPDPIVVATNPDPATRIDTTTHLSAGSRPPEAKDSPPVGLSDGAAAGTVAISAEMVRGFLDRILESSGSQAGSFRPAVPVKDSVPIARTDAAP